MEIKPDIEITADGSQTLRHPVFRDAYHSDRGAVGESMHVFIEAGLSWYLHQTSGPYAAGSTVPDAGFYGRDKPADGALRRSVRILEVGFGSGLNAWLTAKYAVEHQLSIYYESLELYPVSAETVKSLDYAHDPLFVKLHTADWEAAEPVTDGLTLKKRAVSLTDCDFDTTFDLVYFDAFAPETQPELWTEDILRRLYALLNPGGGLVTYSAKGVVKQNLRAAGFEVHRLPGALGKRHMLRAVKG